MTSAYHRTGIVLVLALAATMALGLARAPMPEVPFSVYLPLHSGMEVLAVGIALMVVAAGWAESTRKGVRLRTAILVAAFWGAAWLDLSHLLSFPGMPGYFGVNTPDKTILFWLAARVLIALALLLIVLPHSETSRDRRLLWSLCAAVSILVALLHVWFLGFASTIPAMYDPEAGLTALKISIEYLTATLNVAAIAILLWRRHRMQHYHGPALLGALGTMAISAIYFTLYAGLNDVFNLLGHVFKLASYVFLLRALFFESVTEPYRELMQARSQIEATLEALPDWLFEMDIQGHIHDFKGTETEFLLLPPEQFLARNVRDVVPDHVARATLDAMANALANNGRSQSYEYSLVQNGQPRWYETVAAAKKPVDPVLPRFIILTRDITERKRALAGDQLNAIAFHTREAIMITDAQRRIVRVNPAFTEITGYRESEVVGKNPSFLSSGRHDDDFYRRMWQSIRETGSWQGEIWNKRKNGRIYAEHVVINSVTNQAGELTHYVGSFRDITEHKEAQERIVQLAYYDPLTQLANRRLLIEHLISAQKEGARTGEYSALLFFDLDFFKRLNDTLGHTNGDELLRQFAERIKAHVRDSDTLSRPGGDEFILLAKHLGRDREVAATRAGRLGQKVLDTISRPFRLKGHQYTITVSAGIELFRDEEKSVDELMASADLAMYHAKEQGRNQVYFFETVMQERLYERNRMEADMAQALVENQFVLFYQQQLDAEERTVGFEALLRWHHPQHGRLSPDAFMELAESSGMIVPIGEWVLRTACEHLVRLAENPQQADWSIAVNISERQIREPAFVSLVEAVLEETGANPERLELEITESLLQQDLEMTRLKIEALSRHGVKFSLDDFGTGYSSMAYLKSLPLQVLKIDQSFIEHVTEDERDAAIVEAMVVLAHSLSMTVVAEGVETGAHFEIARHLGCDTFQGYLWGKPQPWPVMARKLAGSDKADAPLS